MEQSRIKKLSNLSIEEKVNKTKRIIISGLKKCPYKNFYLAWTGGKDSTTMLWLYIETFKENGKPPPKTFFINEGSVFEEIIDFVDQFKKHFNIDVTYLKNTDVLEKVKNCGERIRIKNLNNRNQIEIKNLGFTDQFLILEPESLVCNHLLKTVVMNSFIENNQVEMVGTAIRWDEQGARRSEDYFKNINNPFHVRIHPMLHFKEQDIWELIHRKNIPFCSLYNNGYRSLGSKYSTVKNSELPAWEQDLQDTIERSGRDQDKERIMEQLRDLGYM